MEFTTEKINIDGYGEVKITPYLTATQIDTMLEDVADMAYALRRDSVRTRVLLECTDIKELQDAVDAIKNGKDEGSSEAYDIYKGLDSCGIVDEIVKHIRNYDILEEGLKNLDTAILNRNLIAFVQGMTEQFKDIDLDAKQKELEDTFKRFEEVKEEQKELLHG